VRQQLKNVSLCYDGVGVPLPPPSYKHALAQVLFIHISFA
jgi:hypothetical protein